MPLNKMEGENKDEFVSRCIRTEIEAGKEQDQAAAICYSYAEQEFTSLSKWRKSFMANINVEDKLRDMYRMPNNTQK
jgi:hypothetical protein